MNSTEWQAINDKLLNSHDPRVLEIASFMNAIRISLGKFLGENALAYARYMQIVDVMVRSYASSVDMPWQLIGKALDDLDQAAQTITELYRIDELDHVTDSISAFGATETPPSKPASD